MSTQSPGVGQPRIDRPGIPASYGVTKATRYVDWSHIEERLAADRIYWIATSAADARPRVRPVDGLYLDGVIYVGGSPETRWVRHVRSNPNVSLHLDGVDDVVIVEGVAEVLTDIPEDLAARLAAASNEKFPEYAMTPAFYRDNGAIAVRPQTVIAWTDVTKDPTRFRFG